LARINFLASGINNSHIKARNKSLEGYKPDRVLEFYLDTEKRTLTWQYKLLNELSGVNFDQWIRADS